MRAAVYHSKDIQAWEQRWFDAGNSSFGLMQQAAWAMAGWISQHYCVKDYPRVAVWCGSGNNAGDGWFVAYFLQQRGYQVVAIAPHKPKTQQAEQAMNIAVVANVQVISSIQRPINADIQIDALYGIGLNRKLSAADNKLIQQFNQQPGLKIALDIPSGLDANTGVPYGNAIEANETLCVLGYKAGLFTGQGRRFAGQVSLISLIPPDAEVDAIAYLDKCMPVLPQRVATSHKGSHGHVLVVGGHATMGGAAILTAEAAFAVGAGKVTICCDAIHHAAILSRSPNIMLRSYQHDFVELLTQLTDEQSNPYTVIAFGVGLGRDQQAEQIFTACFDSLNQCSAHAIILDADALWWLAHQAEIKLDHRFICTPHPGEAAYLLRLSVEQVESDRLAAICLLQQRFGGQWVLKGAGTLSLDEDGLTICSLGNAGMATAGMGDVLTGVIAGLKAQFQQAIQVHDAVALHAAAADALVDQSGGHYGLTAQQMMHGLHLVLNQPR